VVSRERGVHVIDCDGDRIRAIVAVLVCGRGADVVAVGAVEVGVRHGGGLAVECLGSAVPPGDSPAGNGVAVHGIRRAGQGKRVYGAFVDGSSPADGERGRDIVNVYYQRTDAQSAVIGGTRRR